MTDYVVFYLLALTWFMTMYFVPNGFMYWLCWKKKKKEWSCYRIQKNREPKPGQVKSEIINSVKGLFLFALSATFAYALYKHGYTKIRIFDYPSGHMVTIVFALLAFHETYFYWLHRFMHLRPIYSWVHKTHHLSLTPTPWAAYSNSATESFLLSCKLPIIAILLPVTTHPGAILAFLVVQNLYDTLGHSGYDFTPRWVLARKWLAFHNSPTHHDLHHQYFEGNYGHYISFWDWLMKTKVEQRRFTPSEKRVA